MYKSSNGFYHVLQVDPAAEPEVIKAAYRRLADKYHPDKNKSPDALDRMQRINEAYSVLGDNIKRTQYDRERLQAQSSQSTHKKKESQMPYKAEISRTNPALFVFLLDQSGSMAAQFGGQSSGMSKAQGVADAINRMLSNLAIRCSDGETVRDYFHICVLGFGAEAGKVAPALSGALKDKEVVTISEIDRSPAKIEDRVIKQPDGAGGVIDMPVKFPIWFEPVAVGDTPMAKAFGEASRIVGNWLGNHKTAFPPIVINLTDGEATDTNDILTPARDLTNLSCDDGKVLLFNLHISSVVSAPVLFPESDSSVPDPFGKKMFEMSSLLTATMIDYAKNEKFVVGDNSRGFVFQADLVDLIRFLDIGTHPTELK
jgi:curved DNA-binding protein CbpA